MMYIIKIKSVVKRYFIVFAIIYQSNISAQKNCDDSYISNNVNIQMSHDPVTCAFSLTGSSYYTSNAYPCDPNNSVCFMAPLCIGSCYSWKLFLNGTNIATECNNNSTHTFSNLSLTGIYKVTVQYRMTVSCDNCAIYADVGTINITDNVCGYITSQHNNNQPATVKRQSSIEINCVIQNNKTTILQSSQSIKALPGSKSGVGSNTYFHAYIDNCPLMRLANSNDTIAGSINTSTTNIYKISNQEKTQQTLFDLSPNPTNGIFKLQTNNNLEYPTQIIIRDVMSRNVKIIDNPNAYEHEFNLEKESAGIYMINVYYTDKVISKRIIKN